MKSKDSEMTIKKDDIIKEIEKIQQDFLLKIRKIQNERDAQIGIILKKQNQSNLAKALEDIKKLS